PSDPAAAGPIPDFPEAPEPPAPPLPAAARGSRTLGLLAVAAAALLTGVAFYLVYRTNRLQSLADLVRDGEPFTNFSGSVLHPSFSPDGRTIAYDWSGPNDDNRDIWIHRIDADAPARLTTDPALEVWPVWSPDGGWVAFLRIVEGPAAALVLKPALGGAERILTRFPIGPNDRPRLDWSPDGKWFVTAERPELTSPMRLVLVNAASGALRPLTNPAAGTGGDAEPVFSPDGRTIAYRHTVSSGVEDVYLAGFPGGTPRRLSSDNRGVAALAWRADGRAVIVSSRRAGSVRQLWEFSLQGGEPTRLTPAAIDAGSPAVSRDGRALVFVQTYEDKNIYALDLTDPEAKPRRTIGSVAPDMDPALSPNGALLAFRSLRTGADEIWISAADGSNERRLTRMNGPSTGSAKWTPDGSAIVFASRTGAKGDVYTIPAQGGEARVLTPPSSNESAPFPSPDGRWLYFASDRSGAAEVWRQPLAGGPDAQQITRGGGSGPKLSPDGGTLYYVRPQARPKPAALCEIRLAESAFPVEGSPIVELDNRVTGHWAVARAG
ncbi:MAG TPA: hypothetical protein DEH78_01555, partial [Solibacterales bacterium]|nr:hypothetical protein [Bryobacterales bacterium]